MIFCLAAGALLVRPYRDFRMGCPLFAVLNLGTDRWEFQACARKPDKQAVPEDQSQMLCILRERMLTENNPARFKMLAEQHDRIVACTGSRVHSESGYIR
jgi:hypothetical protein